MSLPEKISGELLQLIGFAKNGRQYSVQLPILHQGGSAVDIVADQIADGWYFSTHQRGDIVRLTSLPRDPSPERLLILLAALGLHLKELP